VQPIAWAGALYLRFVSDGAFQHGTATLRNIVIMVVLDVDRILEIAPDMLAA